MSRVSMRYQNGTTVEANNLGDALVHLATNGVDYLTDVVEETIPGVCKHCDGTGREPERKPKQVLSRKQAEELVAQIDEQAPRSSHDFDARVKVARSLAKD